MAVRNGLQASLLSVFPLTLGQAATEPQKAYHQYQKTTSFLCMKYLKAVLSPLLTEGNNCLPKDTIRFESERCL